MMTNLRRELQQITESTPVDEHPAHIKVLQRAHRHTIKVIKNEYSIQLYTCGVHAFYLVDDPTYVEIAGYGLGSTFAGPGFINFLFQSQLLSPCRPPIFLGDLIIYFHDGKFRHVGRMKSETRVLSKWGTGWLYEHGIWEVPSSYGDDIQYFVGPNRKASLKLFIQYAESRGFKFDGPTNF